MKKNIKMGLMAGLLITPAIIAQAGDVQASETQTPLNVVASITPEQLLNSFKEKNENSSAAEILSERKRFENMSAAEKAILGDDNLKLINAKISYLETIIEVSALDILIDILTTSNKTLIPDTEKAQNAYKELHSKLELISADLTSAASAVEEATATDFLSTLLYYKSNEPQALIEAIVAEDDLKNLADKNALVEELKNFLSDNIETIRETAAETPVVKDAYESAVQKARKNFNEFDENKKDILKIQLVDGNLDVESFIVNAETNLAKANAVEASIQAIQESPPSSTQFQTKVTAILKEYEKLDPLQKALVSNYEDIADYDKTLDVIKKITDLTKLQANSEQLRTDLPVAKEAYETLGTIEKGYVTNHAKLLEILTAVDKVLDVEALITKINTTNVTEAIPAARTAYNDLKTDRKYVLKDSLDLLTSWEKSSSTAANVVKQIDAIATDVFANIDSLTDSRKLSTVTSFVKKVRTAESSYTKIKAAEGESESDQQKLVTNRARLEALIPIATIADEISKLKVTSATYTADLVDAKTALSNWPTDLLGLEGKQQHIANLKAFLEAHLKAQQDEQTVAAKLDEDITALQTAQPVNLEDIATARATYNSLSSNGKRLVKNVKNLSNLERQYKSALTTIKTIDAIEVKKDKAGNKVIDEKGLKDFARKTTSANKSYDKLSQSMQAVVYNKAELDKLLPFAQLIIDIDAIRPTAKDFKEKLSTARTNFTTLFTGYTAPNDLTADFDMIKSKLHEVYGAKLTAHEQLVTSAATIETRIEALKSKSGEAFIEELAKVSADYKALDSATKRNVSNAKTLTDLERDYKASLRVIDLINKLPANKERSYTSKVAAAQKAYDRLTDKQKNDVYNYESKLKNVLKAADLIGRIDKLRVGSKTYEVDVAAIRTEYGQLSSAEKELVYNITNLEKAELSVSDAQEVIALIDVAIPTAESYIQKLIDARKAYDSLDRNNQRLVTNYKELQNRERTVKPVLKLDTDILALDPTNARTFISKYKSAEKAYEKLSISERALLVNTEKFLGDLKSIYHVINTINSVKPSSKTFVEDTQAARALYNALPANLAAQISNLSTLQEHEINVDGGAKVDAMIRALNAAPANEFIAKVKEARNAYKSLSSANKKAVTLESELKEQEKYIKPIEATITAIDGLSNPRNDLSRQFNTVNNALKKLDNKQKEYVTNMDQYSNLSNVIYVYTLIEGLKPNDKYFQGNMEAAKLAYDKLSEQEKLKVTNYYKLQQAVLDMTEVQKVTTIIASLNASSSNFETDIQKALAEYKALPSGSKRQVLNYSTLQQAERDLKAAQRVIKQIDDLDSTLRTYESRAKSAKTAYDRLTIDQKALVKNYNKLQAAVFEIGL